MVMEETMKSPFKYLFYQMEFQVNLGLKWHQPIKQLDVTSTIDKLLTDLIYLIFHKS